ncbi:MAG: hypothetical protein V4819_20770 [Verrucomicrobiota bacterium]
MIEPNPYAPPSAPPVASDHATLGELVRGWEKLRLIYNGILLPPGIGVLMLWITRQNLPIPAAIIGGILVGIGANVAFMLGPLAELYLRGLFRNGDSLGKGRLLVFGAGLVVSGGVMLVFGIMAFL